MDASRFNWVVLLFLLLLPVFAMAVCGNDVCEDSENQCTCAADCGSCSGGVEGGLCKEFYCDATNVCSTRLIPNCCGNQVCEGRENFGSCPADCDPTSVNIDVLSPLQNQKVRYGEELFIKVRATADGGSIASAKIFVNGPFSEVVLFNDGQHDDELFNDNVQAARVVVRDGSVPGQWDLNFSATFREVEGKNSMKIEVYPFVEVNGIIPSDFELGNNLFITGVFSVAGKNIDAEAEAELIDSAGSVLVSDTLKSDSNGNFVFQYRSTLIDRNGTWTFSLKGKDEHENIIDLNSQINVFDAGRLPKRNITLVNTLNESYFTGEEFNIKVYLDEENEPIDGARVVASVLGAETVLVPSGNGEYAGAIKLPSGKIREKANLIVNAFNASKGLIASSTFFIDVVPGVLSVDFLSPEKKLFDVGEVVTFRAFVAYPDKTLANEAIVYVIFNKKRLKLASEGSGLYSAAYKIQDDGQGLLEFTLSAKTADGSEGTSVKELFVKGKGFFYGVTENWGIFIVGALLAVLAATVIAVFMKRKKEHEQHTDMLKELDELEKQAQRMYFHEKSINKAEYSKLIEKYKKQRMEMQHKA